MRGGQEIDSRKVYISGQMSVEICDVQPLLLLPTVLDLRLLFRKLFIDGPYLLSLLDAGIALQGLITQVPANFQTSKNKGPPGHELRIFLVT